MCIHYPGRSSYPQMTWNHQSRGTGTFPGCWCTGLHHRCLGSPHTHQYLKAERQKGHSKIKWEQVKQDLMLLMIQAWLLIYLYNTNNAADHRILQETVMYQSATALKPLRSEVYWEVLGSDILMDIMLTHNTTLNNAANQVHSFNTAPIGYMSPDHKYYSGWLHELAAKPLRTPVNLNSYHMRQNHEENRGLGTLGHLTRTNGPSGRYQSTPAHFLTGWAVLVAWKGPMQY